MSITAGLQTFSVEVVVAGKSTLANDAVLMDYERTSKFLRPL
jgi:hypothetical protein